MRMAQNALVSPSNIRVFVAMNVHSLPHLRPSDPWLQFVPSSYIEGCVLSSMCVMWTLNAFLPVPRPHSGQPPSVSLSVALMKEMSCGRGFLAGLGSMESSYLVQSVPCIKTPDHNDLPAILVLIEYLGALEVSQHLTTPLLATQHILSSSNIHMFSY